MMRMFEKMMLSMLLALFAAIALVAQDAEIVLLHTNDHHGSTETFVLDKQATGGLARRAAYVKKIRAENKNVLLVDAGDVNTGAATSNMYFAEPDFRAMNEMGYDAMTFGNHEFDRSLDCLLAQMQSVRFPFVNANLKIAGKPIGSSQEFVIRSFDGVRVGIFGLTTCRTILTSSPDKSIKFEDEIKAAKRVIPLMKKAGAHVIVCLSHLGDVQETQSPQNTSTTLAAACPEIDIIVDGHSHSKLGAVREENGVRIVSAWEWGKQVGTGKMTVKDGKLAAFDWKPVDINEKSSAEDAEMLALLKPYVDGAKAALDKTIATASDTFVFTGPAGERLTRFKETAIGNMACDALAWYYKERVKQSVDFALINGGNIRSDLAKGDVTMRNLVTVIPFDNYMYLVTMKGSDVVKLFDFVGTINQGSGGFAQVSADVSYTLNYDENGTNGHISDLKIGGKSVDPKKSYRIATNDWLVGGGDGYEAFKSNIDSSNTSMNMRDVVIEYVKEVKNLDPAKYVDAANPRITVASGLKP